MSQRVCRTLRDLAHHPGCIIARCGKCNRVAVFSIVKLARLFRERRWDDSWEAVTPRLRCNRQSGGCGNREVAVAYAQQPGPLIPSGQLCSVYIVPSRADALEWIMATPEGQAQMRWK